MLRCRLSLTLPMSPAQNRGRLADKRTVVLPPTRSLKKELTPSDGDSDGSGPACGQLGLKQENSRVRIMKRRCVSRRLEGAGTAETSRWGSANLNTGLCSIALGVRVAALYLVLSRRIQQLPE